MKSNEEILADVIGVNVKSIALHKSSTVRVDEALEAMDKLVKLFDIPDVSGSPCCSYKSQIIAKAVYRCNKCGEDFCK